MSRRIKHHCPQCGEAAYITSYGVGYDKCRCRNTLCNHSFRVPDEPPAAQQEKYKGIPAGRITIPQYNWNGTRLG